MNEFHVKIWSCEIKDAVIVQAIHAEEIISDSDRAVAERLVELLARTVSDERDLRAITESRQPIGESILRGLRDLGGCRQKWNQEEEKEGETEVPKAGVQELQEFTSCRIGGQISASPALASSYTSYLIQAPPSSRSAARMWLALVIRPEGPAPKGQESLAQGLPWVRRNKRFALKGREMCTRSGSKARSRFSPYLPAPSGLIPRGELTQGKPWAMLFWQLRAIDWKSANCRALRRMNGAKHILDRSSGVAE